ncbi:MAG: LemA family protein [Bacteroidales bacterium]
MKKAIKIIFYALLFIIVFMGLSIYLYNKSVQSTLFKYESTVNAEWSVFFNSSAKRVDLIRDNFSIQSGNPELLVELNETLTDNLAKRVRYKNECSLDFVQLEYELDKKVVFILDSANVNLKNRERWRKMIYSSNNQLNKLIEDYNNSVLNLNEYISMFPNFIIAKNNGYKRKKYFSIKYGVCNEDPIAKSKKLPEWAIGVDTIK